MQNQPTSNEIYRNRYVTGDIVRALTMTLISTLRVLMFPTSIGFCIIATMIIVLLVSDWRKDFAPQSLPSIIGYGILGLFAVGMLFYGLIGLIKIWRNFFRLAHSRQYVFSGQPLATVEDYPKFSGVNDGEIMKYHVGNRTFIIGECSPAGIEKLLSNHKQVRVWYVPSTNDLVKVEILTIS